jgi:hypothetical protein
MQRQQPAKPKPQARSWCGSHPHLLALEMDLGHSIHLANAAAWYQGSWGVGGWGLRMGSVREHRLSTGWRAAGSAAAAQLTCTPSTHRAGRWGCIPCWCCAQT